MVGFLDQRWEILGNLKKSDGGRHYSRSVLLVIAAIFSISGLSMGENLEYCYDHPISIAGWSDNATLPKFDPVLGELTGAKLSISYNPNYYLKFSNNENNSANITINAKGNLSLTLPDKTVLVLASNENRTLLLNPLEEISLNESSNKSQIYVLDSLADFRASSSGDKIVLPVAVSTLSSIRSGEVIMTRVVPQAKASICIIYEFTPAMKGVINGSGTENPVQAQTV